MQKQTDNWYSSWFNTPYYHLLYKNRDDKEASTFMKNLTSFLQLSQKSSILDLACGKGRHSIYLNTLGYNVTGIDLSPQNIKFAKKYENATLRFKEHNMATPLGEKFDAVFNLFTSFGYFEDEADNLNTIKAIKNSLAPNGLGVIDFLNIPFLEKNLVPEEVKTVDDISFHIKRYFKDRFLLKDISFSDLNSQFNFTEKVKALTLEDFKSYFKNSNCTLLNCFGNYALEPYDSENSQRLILIFK